MWGVDRRVDVGAATGAEIAEGADRIEDEGGRVSGPDAPGRESPGCDPSTVEAEARATRVDRVAHLYARVTVATHDFLRAVAECDRHGDWAAEGFGSCAEWLAWRVGLRRNAANERVRVARALEHLPRTSQAMAHAELSYSKVRAITRVATADSEPELLALARSCSAGHLERMVRAFKILDRDDEAKRERLLHRTRRFSVVPDGDGMYVVRGRLTPEVGAALMRAVDAASDALYASASDEERLEDEPARRRADAVGLLSERALAAGMDPGRAPVGGSRAERYQVVLHVEPKTLSQEGEPGLSEMEDGTRVSAETARRLSCDASVVTVTRGCAVDHGSTANPGPSDATPHHAPTLDDGRRTRSVPAALRRALSARDRGCRFPGCGCRFTDGHHIVHWADGGETKLSNLMLLCRRHHRRVHEEGWRVCSDRTGTRFVFFTPTGRALAAAPPLLACPEAKWRLHDDLMREIAEREVGPDAYRNRPAVRYDSDIPWPVEAAAWEALDPPAA